MEDGIIDNEVVEELANLGAIVRISQSLLSVGITCRHRRTALKSRWAKILVMSSGGRSMKIVMVMEPS